MDIIETLKPLRKSGGKTWTTGLSDQLIKEFADRDPALRIAAQRAVAAFDLLRERYGELLARDEPEQIEKIQMDFLNFYPEDAVNPYVPLAASGPWIVTSKGAVIHDSGGYGMLGLGHAPEAVVSAMSQPHVMANIMTANFSQLALSQALRREIGHTRERCPFHRFLAMNSGSEAVTVAARISDVNAKLMTDAGGRHAGKAVKHVALKGGFHGRTDRPAQWSDSTRETYIKHLASFQQRGDLWSVEPNNIVELEKTFERAAHENVFIEALFIEPVMGEGNPGMAITPAFYRRARELTGEHGSLLLVDSIQAGLRAQGVLSIVDYPGFEGEAAPDLETYSKALNAGQYPLSVLAMTESAAALYRKGIYGNTMTANPRAMDVAVAVLESVTPALRENIRRRGKEFLDKLQALQKEMPKAITKIMGTGLLFSCELAENYKIFGSNSTEEYLRRHGIGVIHGGKHSLRYTPHFAITSEEVDLVVAATKDALVNGPGAQERASSTGNPTSVATPL